MSSRTHKRGCLAALLLCVMLLVGCGAATILPTPTPEPVELTFAARRGVADYAPLAEQFHRLYPNITVKLVAYQQGQSFGGGLQNLKTLGVDAFRDTMPYPADPRLKGELFPLDEWIAANKAFPTDILNGVMDALKIDGTQFGVPAGINPVVAYYDSKRFSAVKVPPPSPNWTLSDFLQAAIAVNNQEVKQLENANFTYGFCSEATGIDPVIITYLFGGQLVDNLLNPTRPTLDAAANIRAVQWYASLRSQYGITPAPDELRQIFRSSSINDAIVLGRCGLWIGFYADMGGRAWGRKPVGEPVMMPLPRGQVTFTAASVDGYYILRQSKHPEQAWKWLSFLMEHEEAAGVYMPVQRSQINSEAFASRVSADAVRVARGLPPQVLLVGATIPQGMQSLFATYVQAVDQVVRGQAEAKAALSSAQARAVMLFTSTH